MPELLCLLKYTSGRPVVQLREPCGADELAVENADTLHALKLLDQVLGKGGIKQASAVEAAKIVTADRDRLLAQLYIMMYGPKIESTVNCWFCAMPFDLDFSLRDLLTHSESMAGETSAVPTEDEAWQLPSGVRFRLPTGEDELAIVGFPAALGREALLNRCLLTEAQPEDRDEVEAVMEQIAPVLQIEMSAQCPECGKTQAVQFDMQTFLLNRLKNEHKQTVWEMHRIAATYHWSHADILQLPRSLRKMFVSYIVESERSH